MRAKLKSIDGQRVSYMGIVDRFGIKSGWNTSEQTVLIRDLMHEGEPVTDHLWFTAGKWSAPLKAGDIIRFEARSASYTKGYWDHKELDYRLKNPTQVEVMQQDGSCQKPDPVPEEPRPATQKQLEYIKDLMQDRGRDWDETKQQAGLPEDLKSEACDMSHASAAIDWLVKQRTAGIEHRAETWKPTLEQEQQLTELLELTGIRWEAVAEACRMKGVRSPGQCKKSEAIEAIAWLTPYAEKVKEQAISGNGKASREARNQSILKDAGSGEDTAVIAGRYGLKPATVRGILRDLRKNAPEKTDSQETQKD